MHGDITAQVKFDKNEKSVYYTCAINIRGFCSKIIISALKLTHKKCIKTLFKLETWERRGGYQMRAVVNGASTVCIDYIKSCFNGGIITVLQDLLLPLIRIYVACKVNEILISVF